MSRAWSHGTSSRTMVKLPFTWGSTTTFKPLISWIRRKKSRRSTSFKFTEIGSPEYLPVGAGAGLCPLISARGDSGAGAGAGAGASEAILALVSLSSAPMAGAASWAAGCVNAAGRIAAGAGMPLGVAIAIVAGAAAGAFALAVVRFEGSGAGIVFEGTPAGAAV